MRITAKVHIYVNYTVKVDGKDFEYFDLLDTLRAVKSDCIQITNLKMVKALKNSGIISSPGSRRGGYGASKGPNFDTFLEQLEKKEESVYDEKYNPSKRSIQAARKELDKLEQRFGNTVIKDFDGKLWEMDKYGNRKEIW